MPVPRRKKKNQDFRHQAQRISFARRHRTAFRRISYALLACILISMSGASYSLWKSGYIDDIYAEMAKNLEKHEFYIASLLGLNLKNVYLEGEKYTTVQEIMQAAALKKNQPIFLIDLPVLKERIEELDWVERADVERQIPDSLHINIVEKKPVAVWQNKGELALIDEAGEVISREYVDNFPGLPLVVGEEANSGTSKIITALAAEPELSDKVAAIVRIGGRRWNLRLKNDVVILLPEDDGLQTSITYLAELDKKKQLLSRRIKSVDMRLPDRIFIKEKGDAVAASGETDGSKKNQAANNKNG